MCVCMCVFMLLFLFKSTLMCRVQELSLPATLVAARYNPTLLVDLLQSGASVDAEFILAACPIDVMDMANPIGRDMELKVPSSWAFSETHLLKHLFVRPRIMAGLRFSALFMTTEVSVVLELLRLGADPNRLDAVRAPALMLLHVLRAWVCRGDTRAA